MSLQLKDWLKQNRYTVTAAAKEIGVGRQFLSDIINGRNRPGLDVAVKIEEFTSGAISPKLWMSKSSEIEPKSQTPKGLRRIKDNNPKTKKNE